MRAAPDLAMVPERARVEVFKYDPNGNVYEAAPGDPERVYGPGNRLLEQGNTRYAWDGDGRLVEKKIYHDHTRLGDPPRIAWKYAWNAQGLMAWAESSNGVVVEFSYDAFGRRLEKRVGQRSANRPPPYPPAATTMRPSARCAA